MKWRNRRCDGDGACWLRLGYAILAQAVEDVRGLQADGMIRDGRAVHPWPTRRDRSKVRSRLLRGCVCAAEADRLIAWLRRDAGRLLATLGSDMTPADICRRIGIGEGRP